MGTGRVGVPGRERVSTAGVASRDRAIGRVLGIAARQYGLFTTEQARAAGVTDRMLERRIAAGAWLRVHPGVHRVAGAPISWRGGVLAACFAWGSGAVASHRCAAALWELQGFAPGAIELTVPRKRQRALDHLVHRPVRYPSDQVTSIHGIPATAVEQALLDVAGCSSLNVVEEALDDALRRRLTTIERMRALIERNAVQGRAGITVMRALIAEHVGEVPESVFERRLLRVLATARLRPVLQYEVRQRGRLVARVDLAFPEHRIAVEADGFRWHSMRRDFERDARRHSALAALGWRVIRVTWRRLQDRPHDVVDAVRQAIAHGRP